MAFLEDDELDPAPRRRGPRRGGGGPRRGGDDPQRDILVRRLIALLVGIGLLLIVVFGVRSCLDSRKERGFENYASDLTAIVNETNQLSEAFFTRLRTPPQQESPLNLEAQIATDRGTAQSLLNRVEGLDAPDDLSGAQANLVKSYELRLDALTGISEEIPNALAEEGRADAVDAITLDMRSLLASDVLFSEAVEEINEVFAEEEIAVEEVEGGGVVPGSIFLPEPVSQWIDDDQLSVILSAFASAAEPVSGVHGLELISVSVGDTTLVAGEENSTRLRDPLEVTADVTNGGDSDEVDVVVSAEIAGPTGIVEGEAVITRIESLDSAEAEIQIEPPPPTDTPLTLEVTAQPVLGETLFDNNTLTYTVTFN